MISIRKAVLEDAELITEIKKAAYNKVYNKTSFSLWDLFK